MTNESPDERTFDDVVARALDRMDGALDPDGKGGTRKLPPGERHDRIRLLAIWRSSSWEEIARAAVPTIEAIISRLGDAQSAADAVVGMAPDWGRYPEDLFGPAENIVEHEEWRWHNQRGAIRLVLEELRGLRSELLARCSRKFQKEWEAGHGKPGSQKSGTFLLTRETQREILPDYPR